MIASKKITSNSIRLFPVFIRKKIWSWWRHIFSCDKMRNSGNCIYNYAQSFFGENFQSNALYWFYIPDCSGVTPWGVASLWRKFWSYPIGRCFTMQKVLELPHGELLRYVENSGVTPWGVASLCRKFWSYPMGHCATM